MTAPVRERPLIRPATTAAILAANDEPIEWPGLAGWPYLEHLLAHCRLLVAELEDSVAGFGGTVGPRGPKGGTFLTDLFVRPDLHGRGIGGALLAELFPSAGPRATFASSDPRAQPLYIRFGMLPRWPNLYLGGESGALPATWTSSWPETRAPSRATTASSPATIARPTSPTGAASRAGRASS